MAIVGAFMVPHPPLIVPEVGRGSVPLHISRFFLRFHMRDRGPTPAAQVYRLADAAGEMLEYVYTGNC